MWCSFISIWFNLKFIELFYVSKFKEYEKNSPEFLFESIGVIYGKYFDFMKLKSELVYLYSTTDYHLKYYIIFA